MLLRTAVFLDRDGTLIRDAGYIRDPDLVKLLPGAVPTLRLFGDLGYLLVIVSNQSGIGRGLVTPAECDQVQARVIDLLQRRGVHISATYYCPHAPGDNCECRKPKPELLLRASRDLRIDLSRSYMIGDKLSDAEAGLAAGCSTILFQPPDSSSAPHVPAPNGITPDHVCPDWQCIGKVVSSRNEV